MLPGRPPSIPEADPGARGEALARLGASEMRFGFNVAQNLECRADATVLQVLTTAGVLKGEIAFAGNTGPVTAPNAQLVALLRSETDFKLRAYYALAGLRSLNSTRSTPGEANSE